MNKTNNENLAAGNEDNESNSEYEDVQEFGFCVIFYKYICLLLFDYFLNLVIYYKSLNAIAIQQK